MCSPRRCPSASPTPSRWCHHRRGGADGASGAPGGWRAPHVHSRFSRSPPSPSRCFRCPSGARRRGRYRGASAARPAGRRLQAHGVVARRRDRDRPRSDGHANPAANRRRREVRRVLRARAGDAPAGRSRHDREHVARVRGDVRVLPRGRRDDPLPAPDRAARGAHRPGRGLLQGKRPLARPGRGADVFPGGRARSLHGRAFASGTAPAAGPDCS